MIVYLSCFWSFAWSYWKRAGKLVFTRVTFCFMDLSPNLSPSSWPTCVLPFFASPVSAVRIDSLRASIWGNDSAPALSFIPFTWLFYLIGLFTLNAVSLTVLSSGTKKGRGGVGGGGRRAQGSRGRRTQLVLYVAWLLISFYHWITSRCRDVLQCVIPINYWRNTWLIALGNYE